MQMQMRMQMQMQMQNHKFLYNDIPHRDSDNDHFIRGEMRPDDNENGPERASGSIISTSESSQESTGAGQFVDEQKSGISLAILTNSARKICMRTAKTVQRSKANMMRLSAKTIRTM
jgi:hypothetical protein